MKAVALLLVLCSVHAFLPRIHNYNHLFSQNEGIRRCRSISGLSMVAQIDVPSFSNDVLLENVKGRTYAMKWDSTKGTFQPAAMQETMTQDSRFVSIIKSCFIPSGAITSDYYKYSMWRLAQRFVSATCSVFGTQALLLALGFKKEKIGIAAATTWVLKDALGKFSRIFWASKHGRKFDSDAKKWRFRSSILFATGNGLEILTYIVPSLFLLTAALANAMKQMAMLTSSATRNTIYKSFARKSDNIGDITAKGEAQIAVIDLVGMGAGIIISRAIGTSRHKISATFLLLSLIDLICIFNEIKSVVFTTLNFERSGMVLRHLLAVAKDKPIRDMCAVGSESGDDEECTATAVAMEDAVKVTDRNDFVTSSRNKWWQRINSAKEFVTKLRRSTSTVNSSHSSDQKTSNGNIFDNGGASEIDRQRPVATGTSSRKSLALTPAEVAAREPIFFPSRFAEDMFKSWSGLQVDADVLQGSMEVFRRSSISADSYNDDDGRIVSAKDRFIVTLDARIARSWADARRVELLFNPCASLRSVQGIPVVLSPQVLLHKDASPLDVFRAIVVVQWLIAQFEARSEPINASAVGAKLLQLAVEKRRNGTTTSSESMDVNVSAAYSKHMLPQLGLGSADLISLLRDANKYEHDNLPAILSLLQTAGWDTNKYTFGNLRTRVDW